MAHRGAKSSPRRLTPQTARFLQYLRSALGYDGRERVHAVFFGNGESYLADSSLADGGFSTVKMRLRPMVERALAVGAQGVMLAHNHPSGHCHPSEADIGTTRYIQRLLYALDLTLLDHLIVTDGRAYSMKAGGLL